MRTFSIDGFDMYTEYKMVLTKRYIPVIPEVKLNENDIGGMDGVIDGTLKFGKNNITLQIKCKAKPSELYENIRGFINSLNPKLGERELSFSDEPNVIRYVRLVNGNDIDEFYSDAVSIGEFQIDFKMANPFTYSKNIKKYYFNGVSNSTATLVNDGGIDCPVKIKVYAPKGIVTTRYEETHPNITYVGASWTVYSTTLLSGGSSKYATVKNDYCEFTFTGTGIRWFAHSSGGKGIANVSIDGGAIIKVDTYANPQIWQNKVFEKLDLTNGTHKIKIEVAMEKNPLSSLYNINIDAFEVVASSIPIDVLPLTLISGTAFNYASPPSVYSPKVIVNNEYVKFNSTIDVNSELVIDTKTLDMKLNGINVLQNWEGDFPLLKVGYNTISEYDNNTTGALIIFEYRERWL